MKNKICKFWIESKDIALSYLNTFTLVPAIMITILFVIKSAIKEEVSYSLINIGYNTLASLCICALVLGCISIQYIRFFMLSGKTRKDSFLKTLALNSTWILVYSSLLYLIFSLKSPMFFLFAFTTIMFFYSLGFFFSSLSTTMNGLQTGILITVFSALILFSLKLFINFDSFMSIGTIVALLGSILFTFLTHIVLLSKRSDLKSTNIQ